MIQDEHISDSVQRQAWDQQYQRLYGVMPTPAPAPVHVEPAPYQPGDIAFSVTTRDGRFDWTRGTSRDLVESVGADTVRLMLSHTFQGAAPRPQYAQQYVDPQPPRQIAPAADLSFPPYPNAIAPQFQNYQPAVEPANSPVQATAIKQATTRLQLAWRGLRRDRLLLALWIGVMMTLFANPSPQNFGLREPMLKTPTLSWVIHLTDPINVVRWIYLWRNQPPAKEPKK